MTSNTFMDDENRNNDPSGSIGLGGDFGEVDSPDGSAPDISSPLSTPEYATDRPGPHDEDIIRDDAEMRGLAEHGYDGTGNLQAAVDSDETGQPTFSDTDGETEEYSDGSLDTETYGSNSQDTEGLATGDAGETFGSGATDVGDGGGFGADLSPSDESTGGYGGSSDPVGAETGGYDENLGTAGAETGGYDGNLSSAGTETGGLGGNSSPAGVETGGYDENLGPAGTGETNEAGTGSLRDDPSEHQDSGQNQGQSKDDVMGTLRDKLEDAKRGLFGDGQKH